MHHTALGGVSQSPPPAAQTGDVDADGEIVDALTRRLDAAIGPCAPSVDRERHLHSVLLYCGRVAARIEAGAS